MTDAPSPQGKPPPMAWQATNAMRGELHLLTAVRGLAALWVFAGHSVNLASFKLPIIDQPSMAVDIFILLSGFVMVYTARAGDQALARPTTATYADFLARRFWRLSPAFFVVFAIAMGLAEWTGELRSHLSALGSPAPKAERYTDTSLANVLLHLSYVFGLLPAYSSRSPLPDWSISLEMQFYVVFPMLFWICARRGWIGFALIVAFTAALLVAFPGYFDAFSKPSALPMKINLFLAGMLLADLVTQGNRPIPTILIVMLLAAMPSDGDLLAPRNLVRPALALLLAVVILWERAGSNLAPARILRWAPFQFAGTISYSVYLFHLVVLVPIEAILARDTGLRGPALAAASFAASLPIVIGGSALLYRFVERPGIHLGRRFGMGRVRQDRSSPAVDGPA